SDLERPEGRDFHHLPAFKCLADFFQNGFDKFRRFVSGKTNLFVNSLAQIRTGNGLTVAHLYTSLISESHGIDSYFISQYKELKPYVTVNEKRKNRPFAGIRTPCARPTTAPVPPPM